jgi:hypothetical protein
MSLPDLKTIQDRCIEEGECWLWAQHLQSGGHPTASHGGKPTLVRRRAFELGKGYLPNCRTHAIVNTCDNTICCNPDHLASITRAELVRRSYKQTRVTAMEYPARLAARVRQGTTKLNLELARELRLNEAKETAAVAAARLEVSESLVNKIRQGLIWREAAPNCSVFNMTA